MVVRWGNRCLHCGLDDGLHVGPTCTGIDRPRRICLMIEAASGGRAQRCQNPRGFDVGRRGDRWVVIEDEGGGFCKTHAYQAARILSGDRPMVEQVCEPVQERRTA